MTLIVWILVAISILNAVILVPWLLLAKARALAQMKAPDRINVALNAAMLAFTIISNR